ncbi:exocyst complex component 6B-like, partial [Pseudochaenichthys georgianus]|uniref:exocyst complex component 6B-like n=1 Tax=Pseudochaenichthys georgianus TaxID=52239 RepID=UPI0039C33519
SVYDGREHGLFVEELDVRIRNHDREIEKMCNHHFQGFVDSITELLKVRGEAQKLKSQVTETNRHLQDEGKELMASMEELQKCRVQQRNIASTIDKLTHCLPVLDMYSRLQEQMRAKRYYPALRTLEQLELTCLPRAGEYRFCSIMAENIPKLRTQIRDTAMTQLRDFLESIRKHSDKIGETAIKQAKIQRSLDSSVSSQPRALIGRRRKEAMMMNVNGIDGTPVSEQDSGILDVEDEEEEEEEEEEDVPGAQDLVDFSPVYRCLHIYTVLLLELFTQWDWSSYLADYGKPSCKYLRVNPHTALTLLEKMRETSRKNNVFAQFRKTDRDRQKLIDTIVKQLRNLIAQQQA